VQHRAEQDREQGGVATRRNDAAVRGGEPFRVIRPGGAFPCCDTPFSMASGAENATGLRWPNCNARFDPLLLKPDGLFCSS